MNADTQLDVDQLDEQADWCEIQATVQMLDLAVTHLKMSMAEGNESVEDLGD